MTDEKKNAEETPEEEKVEEPVEAAGDVEVVAEETSTEGAETAEEVKAETVEVEVEKTVSGAEKALAFTSTFLRDDHPDFKAGDTIKVHLRIVEGGKERVQVFEGIVISLKHAGLDRTFTVRKVTEKVGVERTFFYHSKKIDKIQLVRRGRVRRAKIYYLRKRIGKAARIKELRRPKAGKKAGKNAK